MRQRPNSGIIGPLTAISVSGAVGFNTLVDVQQNIGANRWPKPGYAVEYLVVAGGGGGGGGESQNGYGGGDHRLPIERKAEA